MRNGNRLSVLGVGLSSNFKSLAFLSMAFFSPMLITANFARAITLSLGGGTLSLCNTEHKFLARSCS